MRTFLLGQRPTAAGATDIRPHSRRSWLSELWVDSPAFVLLLVGLCLLAYLPAINNGFISDDFVMLEQIGTLKQNPLYLFMVPPLNFRLTSYVVFGVFKSVVGYRYQFFYLFNILLHLANSILFWRLALLLTRDRRLAAFAAVMFAVFKAPHEAVMWLAAMNETLLAFFVFATLLSWLKGRYGLALLCYCGALFSKESGLIVLALVPLLNLYRRQRPFPLPWFLFWLPTGLVGWLLLSTWSANFMAHSHTYAIGPHVVPVIVVTLHKLLWPWFWLALVGVRLARGHWTEWRRVATMLAMVVVPMLPYIFLIYQTGLPSRQLYLASAVFVLVLAMLLVDSGWPKWQYTFLLAFVIFNVAILWFRSNPQTRQSAAPTTQLVRELKTLPPAPTLILNFGDPKWPQVSKGVGKAAAWLAPGWRPELIIVGDSRDDCQQCRVLRWDRQMQRYEREDVR